MCEWINGSGHIAIERHLSLIPAAGLAMDSAVAPDSGASSALPD